MKKYLSFYTLASLAVITFLVLRAANVNVTYDEAWTLMDFVNISIPHILNCSPCDANNHILNSLLIKLVWVFSPDTLFWGRLPNLLAAALYLFVGSKISRRFLAPWLGYSFFVLLIANPFVLDFFGLARGYGLSLAFLLTSVYFLLRYRETVNFKNGFWGLAFASMAVLSNYALLNYWFAAFFIIFYVRFLNQESTLKWAKVVAVALGWAVFLLAVLYQPIRKLVEQDGLYFGGSTGFYNETVTTLARYSLYNPWDDQTADWVMWTLTALLTAGMVLGLASFRKLGEFLGSRALLISILVAIPILSNIAQWILFETLYLVARTALFYYPLFVLLFIFWWAEIKLQALVKGTQIMAGLLAVAFTWNVVRNANIHKTITWEFDSRTTEILENLQAQAEREDTDYTIGAVRLYIRGLLYQIDEYPNLSYVLEDNIKDSLTTDYYLYYNRELMRIGYFMDHQDIYKYEKDTVLQFPDEGVYVFSNFVKKEETD